MMRAPDWRCYRSRLLARVRPSLHTAIAAPVTQVVLLASPCLIRSCDAFLGLTLTAATLVLFAELTWVPGELLQAEDRSHRIGQAASVDVHYLIAKGTIDEMMWQTLDRKVATLGAALDGASGATLGKGQQRLDEMLAKKKSEADQEPAGAGAEAEGARCERPDEGSVFLGRVCVGGGAAGSSATAAAASGGGGPKKRAMFSIFAAAKKRRRPEACQEIDESRVPRAGDRREWACAACTFRNPASRKTCSMCGADCPAAPASTVALAPGRSLQAEGIVECDQSLLLRFAVSTCTGRLHIFDGAEVAHWLAAEGAAQLSAVCSLQLCAFAGQNGDEEEQLLGRLPEEIQSSEGLRQVLSFVAAWELLTPKQQAALACRPLRPPLLPAVAHPPRLLRTTAVKSVSPARAAKKRSKSGAAVGAAAASCSKRRRSEGATASAAVGTVGSTVRETTSGDWVRRMAGAEAAAALPPVGTGAAGAASEVSAVIRLASGVDVRLLRWTEAAVSKSEARRQSKKAAAALQRKKAKQDEIIAKSAQQRSITDLMETKSEVRDASSTAASAATSTGEVPVPHEGAGGPVVWEQLFEAGGQRRPCCVLCLAPYPEAHRKEYNSAFCSQECSAEFGVRSSQSSARRAVYARDKGVCAACGRDAAALFARLAALPDVAPRLALLEEEHYRYPHAAPAAPLCCGARAPLHRQSSHRICVSMHVRADGRAAP
eukprot:SAG11_NODE_1465_length_4859_cov_9.864916_2_plen_716_part_00